MASETVGSNKEARILCAWVKVTGAWPMYLLLKEGVASVRLAQ